jgi:hypothetical protein
MATDVRTHETGTRAALGETLVGLEVQLAFQLLGVVTAVAVLREDLIDLREGGLGGSLLGEQDEGRDQVQHVRGLSD